MSTETPPARRRIARSGPIALIASVVLVVWVVLTVWLALIAAKAAGVIATILFFASWVVVPCLAIAIIVFAIVALLFNPVPGKIMGAFAIVLPVVVAAVFWGSLSGFSEQLPGL